MTPAPLRLVVLISGNGSNLQAIIDAIGQGDLRAEIAAIFSNCCDAYGLVRAERAGIPARCFPFGPYRMEGRSRAAYDADLAAAVAGCNPGLVVLAGWMRVLGPAFLDRFPGRVINLHPALPGQFPGTDAIARAYAAYGRGEITGTGIMVHYVVPAVDAGPVLATAPVPIYGADRQEDLEARVHQAEHRLLVQVIAQLAADAAGTA